MVVNNQSVTDNTILKWIFNGAYITTDNIPKSAIGFIYIIKHLDGTFYIGRKNLFVTKTKQIKGKKKKYKAGSDWENYWSSSEQLKERVIKDGADKFTREILMFCDTASQMLYLEECMLYHTNAILMDNCLNDNIRAKVYRKWFTDIKNDKFKTELLKLKAKF